MSGRIRTIKPELLDDEPTAGLSDTAWRLYLSLHLCADDYGNTRLGAKYVAAVVWQDTSRDPEAAIAELVAKRFLVPYAKSEQAYGRIRGWEKHQRIDNRGKARVPSEEEDDGSLPTWFRAFRRRFAADSCKRVRARREPLRARESSPLARALRPDPTRPDPTTTNEGPEEQPATPGGEGGNPEAAKEKLPEQSQSPLVLVSPVATPTKKTPAEEVHAHFLAVRKRYIPKAREVALSPKDKTQLDAALKRGFSVADMKLAVDGLFLSPHHLGQNDRETKYLEFMYVTRNVEKFIQLAEAGTGQGETQLPILRLPNRGDFIPRDGEAPDLSDAMGGTP